MITEVGEAGMCKTQKRGRRSSCSTTSCLTSREKKVLTEKGSEAQIDSADDAMRARVEKRLGVGNRCTACISAATTQPSAERRERGREETAAPPPPASLSPPGCVPVQQSLVLVLPPAGREGRTGTVPPCQRTFTRTYICSCSYSFFFSHRSHRYGTFAQSAGRGSGIGDTASGY